MLGKWPHSVWTCMQNLLDDQGYLGVCGTRFVRRSFSGGSTSNAFSASVDTSRRRPVWLRIGHEVDGETPEIEQQPHHERVPDLPDTIGVLCNTSSDRPRFPTQFDPIVSRLFRRTNQRNSHIPICGSESFGVNLTQPGRDKTDGKHTTERSVLYDCRSCSRGPARY